MRTSNKWNQIISSLESWSDRGEKEESERKKEREREKRKKGNGRKKWRKKKGKRMRQGMALNVPQGCYKGRSSDIECARSLTRTRGREIIEIKSSICG